jgi:hypothetical protein
VLGRDSGADVASWALSGPSTTPTLLLSAVVAQQTVVSDVLLGPAWDDVAHTISAPHSLQYNMVMHVVRHILLLQVSVAHGAIMNGSPRVNHLHASDVVGRFHLSTR